MVQLVAGCGESPCRRQWWPEAFAGRLDLFFSYASVTDCVFWPVHLD